MMRHIFLTEPDMQSPRWKQAFPAALIIEHIDDLPANLTNTFLWLLVDNQLPALLPEWLAAGARLVVLSKMESPTQAKQAIERGAHGYLHYLAAVSVLKQVREVVGVGGLWLGAELMRQLVFATAVKLTATNQGSLPALSELTLREKMVAEAVAAGKSNKEVARDLAITERTVKAHLSVVFEKLNVRDRLQLVLVMAGQ